MILMSVLSSTVEEKNLGNWVQDIKEGKVVIFNNIFLKLLFLEKEQKLKK